jgi:hypothetical protein
MFGMDAAAAEAPNRRASVLREKETLKTSPRWQGLSIVDIDILTHHYAMIFSAKPF